MIAAITIYTVYISKAQLINTSQQFWNKLSI